MADSKTSGLPAVASVTDAQEFPVNDGGTSRKATALQIKTYAGVSGLATAGGGTALADNKAVRGDGTTGIQGSLLEIADDGALATAASKSLSFGTTASDVQVRGNSAAGTIDSRTGDNSAWKGLRAERIRALDAADATKIDIQESEGVTLSNNRAVGWSANTNAEDVMSAKLEYGAAAGVIKLTDCFLLPERASAPAAVANSVVVYAIDNGAGKTQLMAIFPTGAAVQLAIEP